MLASRSRRGRRWILLFYHLNLAKPEALRQAPGAGAVSFRRPHGTGGLIKAVSLHSKPLISDQELPAETVPW